MIIRIDVQILSLYICMIYIYIYIIYIYIRAEPNTWLFCTVYYAYNNSFMPSYLFTFHVQPNGPNSVGSQSRPGYAVFNISCRLEISTEKTTFSFPFTLNGI